MSEEIRPAPSPTGAPTTADYLVGTADAGLSAEIVVGATPGGELGGTWASPTVDSVHSGSAHGTGFPAGTSFPGSPSTNDLYHRTDRRLLYFYDGTRWLTVTLYNLPLMLADALIPFTTTVTGHRATVPYAGVYDLWLEDFQSAFYVNSGTALGASHKWVATLVKAPAGTTVATINIDSGASATHRNSGQIAIDALVGTSEFSFYVTYTKTGTPGSLFIYPTLTYRIVG